MKLSKIFSRITLLIIILLIFFQFSYTQEWRIIRSENTDGKLLSNFINTVLVDSNNIKWFGTDSGLCGYDGENWFTYTVQDSLAGDYINNITQELNDSANIWIATSYGVSILNVDDSGIRTLNPPIREHNSGLVSNSVSSVAIDTGHVKWFGTDEGISLNTGDVWESYSELNLLPANVVLTLAVTINNWIYAGTEGGGVARLQYDKVDGVTGASTIDTDWSGIASDTVTSILIDSDQVGWYGTAYGVSRHEGTDVKINWTQYTEEDGLANNCVLAIAEDNNKAKWFGTTGGLSLLNGDKWTSWTIDSESGLAGDTINDIAVDQNGSIWLATNNGVSHFTPGTNSITHDQVKIPEAHQLIVYPNPFNMETSIEVELKTSQVTKLTILNILGQKVRQFESAQLSSGSHIFKWNGRDDFGQPVSSGIYIVYVQLESRIVKNKIVLIK